MRRMPAVDSDDGEPRSSESVRHERAGDARANNRYVATAVARQWWRYFSQPVAKQPEGMRRRQLQVLSRFMSAISRTRVAYPFRATASIARPSCSVVVISVGARRRRRG